MGMMRNPAPDIFEGGNRVDALALASDGTAGYAMPCKHSATTAQSLTDATC